jgi:DNA invertase Pin-like site-specific DNA recombinase
MTKQIAIYLRVSSKRQDTRSQIPDLKRWADAQDDPIRWFEDKQTGTTMERPGWLKLEQSIRSGKISHVVVWRLDRLGRTASGLTALFEVLRERKVNLVSIKDGLDLSTSAGRLMANILASIAQFETELRGERIRAGIEAAKANGKTWGGSKAGVRKKVDRTKERLIKRMRADGEKVSAIARTLGLSRPTVYDVLKG